MIGRYRVILSGREFKGGTTNAPRPEGGPGYRKRCESRASLAKDGGCAAGECVCSPPEDTGAVQALSSGGGGGLIRGAGVDVRDVPVQAYGS